MGACGDDAVSCLLEHIAKQLLALESAVWSVSISAARTDVIGTASTAGALADHAIYPTASSPASLGTQQLSGVCLLPSWWHRMGSLGFLPGWTDLDSSADADRMHAQQKNNDSRQYMGSLLRQSLKTGLHVHETNLGLEVVEGSQNVSNGSTCVKSKRGCANSNIRASTNTVLCHHMTFLVAIVQREVEAPRHMTASGTDHTAHTVPSSAGLSGMDVISHSQ
eukprot:3099316-Amphidinium_carterae.1